MAKSALQTKSDAAPRDEPSSAVEVTYKPTDPTEPNVITWNRIEFAANVPVLLDPVQHFIVIDQAFEVTLTDGSPARRTRPTKVSMIEIAKGNASFEVAGFPRAQRIKPAKPLPPAGAQWEGTDRDELIRDMAQVTDFDPRRVGALVITR
jgi:hypothetical protein